MHDRRVIRAIKQARELRQQVDAGHDPQQAKAAARTLAPAGKTVADLLDEHVARYIKKSNLRTADHIERTFERLVKPCEIKTEHGKRAVGSIGIYEIRRSHIVAMLDTIEDEHGPVTADRTVAYVRKAFNWYAIRDDQFNTPIVRGMARTKPRERAGMRTLADDEIRDLWAALDNMTKPSCYPAYVRSLLLTAQRRTEVSDMPCDELDGEIWIISAEQL
jgi:integrase